MESGPWGVVLHNEGVPNHSFTWLSDGTNALSAQHHAIHEDPLCATAHASTLAATNLAIARPLAHTRLAAPTSWNTDGSPGSMLSYQPTVMSAYLPSSTFSSHSFETNRSAPPSMGNQLPLPRTPAALLGAQHLQPGTHPRVTCEIPGCRQSFLRVFELDRHKGTEHGIGSLHYHCLQVGCGYQYTRLDKVREHCRKKHRVAPGGERVRSALGADCEALSCPLAAMLGVAKPRRARRQLQRRQG